jgi:hypothetical protein
LGDKAEELKALNDKLFRYEYIENEVNQAFENVSEVTDLQLSPFLYQQSIGIDFVQQLDKESKWVQAEIQVIQGW